MAKLECGAERISDVIVLVTSVVVLALSITAVTVPWTEYSVSSSLEEEALSGVSVGLDALYSRWPQMFYPRSVQLQQVCFPQVDFYIWVTVFRRSPKICGRKRSTTICLCMSISEYQEPVNRTKRFHQSEDQLTLIVLYRSCVGLIGFQIAMSIVVLGSIFGFRHGPKVIGSVGFIATILEVCSVVAAVVVFCSLENQESVIKQPPHLGFIRTIQHIDDATTVSRTHGFAVSCSVIAFAAIKAVFYTFSWASRLQTAAKNGQRDEAVEFCSDRCCCCPPEDGSRLAAGKEREDGSTALTAGRQYGAIGAEDFDSTPRDKLSH